MALFEPARPPDEEIVGSDAATRALSVTAVENEFVSRVYENIAWFYDLTFGPALHPGRSGRVLIDGQPAGWLGELHPRWQQKYELQPAVLFELDAAILTEVRLPRPTQPSKFPPVVRDIALLVAAGVPAQIGRAHV